MNSDYIYIYALVCAALCGVCLYAAAVELSASNVHFKTLLFKTGRQKRTTCQEKEETANDLSGL